MWLCHLCQIETFTLTLCLGLFAFLTFVSVVMVASDHTLEYVVLCAGSP